MHCAVLSRWKLQIYLPRLSVVVCAIPELRNDRTPKHTFHGSEWDELEDSRTVGMQNGMFASGTAFVPHVQASSTRISVLESLNREPVVGIQIDALVSQSLVLMQTNRRTAFNVQVEPVLVDVIQGRQLQANTGTCRL